jgi:hypothetical protein
MPDLVDRDISEIDAALWVLIYRHFVEPPFSPRIGWSAVMRRIDRNAPTFLADLP